MPIYDNDPPESCEIMQADIRREKFTEGLKQGKYLKLEMQDQTLRKNMYQCIGFYSEKPTRVNFSDVEIKFQNRNGS